MKFEAIFNKRFSKSWYKALIISFLSVLVSMILYNAFGGQLLPYLGIDNNNSFYVKNYYDRMNGKHSIYYPSPDSIIIIATQNLNDTQNLNKDSTRLKIAELINKVCKFGPSAVGLDIRFVGKRDPQQDSVLLDAIRRNSKHLILAQALNDNGTIPSILDSVPCSDSLKFGITNLPDFYKYTDTIGKYPVFSYEVARLANPGLTVDFNHFSVNYKTTYFPSMSASEFLKTDSDLQREIKGKVILLGDTNNEKDYHHTPFLIDGQEYTQGIYLHAYAINSLLHNDIALKTMSGGVNFCICFLFCFLFSWIFVLLSDNKRIKHNVFIQKHYWLFILLRPVFLLLTDGFVYLLCYFLLTKSWGYIPDVVMYMISVLLISTFKDFVSSIIINGSKNG